MTARWLPGAWGDISEPSFTVVGLGRSGLAAAEALAAHGAPVRVVDEYDTPEVCASAARLSAGVPVSFGDLPAARPGEVYVVSPGFVADSPRYFDLVDSGHPVVDETEVFFHLMRARFRDHPCRIVGVTGTNGKTTTTALIGHLLKETGVPAVVGGNIGLPLCAQLDDLTPETVVVAELSEIHLLGQTAFHNDVAVITNIDYDHVIGLPVFGGVAANYHACKWSITDRLTAEDTLVYSADCPHTRVRTDNGPHAFRLVPVSRSHRQPGMGWWMSGSAYRCASGEPVAGRADVSTLAVGEEQLLLGEHNDANVLMALAVMAALGADLTLLPQALSSFRSPAHRVNLLSGISSGQTVIDDSKATNPPAALAALEIVRRTYPGRRLVWLGGGQSDQTSKADLVSRLPTVADAVVLIGESAEEFANLLRPGMTVRVAGSMQDAVRTAFAELGGEPGVLLLSPAAKSFDMFRDYADRARVFREAVAETLTSPV